MKHIGPQRRMEQIKQAKEKLKQIIKKCRPEKGKNIKIWIFILTLLFAAVAAGIITLLRQSNLQGKPGNKGKPGKRGYGKRKRGCRHRSAGL